LKQGGPAGGRTRTLLSEKHLKAVITFEHSASAYVKEESRETVGKGWVEERKRLTERKKGRKKRNHFGSSKKHVKWRNQSNQGKGGSPEKRGFKL